MTRSTTLPVAVLLSLLALAGCEPTANAPATGAAPVEPRPNTAAAMLGVMDLNPATRAAAEAACLEQAAQMLIEIANQNFATARGRFAPALEKALSEKDLQSGWLTMATGHAGFDRIQRGYAETLADSTVAYVPIEFKNGRFTVKVACDAAKKVSGLWFIGDVPRWSPPPWDKPGTYKTEEVTIGDAPWQLPGTVTTPPQGGPHPTLVLVHGTGPNDRDGSIGPTKLFKDLAIGLAQRGIATLRYEKRTRFYARRLEKGAVKGLDLDQETVLDAAAAVAFAQKHAGLDPKRVYLLGHDLGGFALPRILDRAAGVAGAVVAAGMARPLEEADLDQARYLFGLDDLTDEEKNKIKELEARVALVKQGAPPNTPADVLPMGLPPSYWQNVRGYEPAVAAAKIELPLLVLHAGRDYHVNATDLGLWRAALGKKSNVKFTEYAHLNHNFMAPRVSSRTTPARPGEYVEIGYVDVTVLEDLKKFVLSE